MCDESRHLLPGARSKRDFFKLPEALSLRGNPSENWSRWIQRFDFHLTESGKIKEDDKVQCAILLLVIGKEALEIYNNTFKFATGGDPNKIFVLKKKFEDYVNPRKNTMFERFRSVLGLQTAGRRDD